MKWVLALWLIGHIAWAQTADPVAYYSATATLEDKLPLDGATLAPGVYYFSVEPGTRWRDMGITTCKMYCCKDLVVGDRHDTKITGYLNDPWVDSFDLTGMDNGNRRELYTDCYFPSPTPYEHFYTNFTVDTPRPPNMPKPIGDLKVEVRY